jgi:hypothetical protein
MYEALVEELKRGLDVRITIIGAGAMGGLFGGLLARSGVGLVDWRGAWRRFAARGAPGRPDPARIRSRRRRWDRLLTGPTVIFQVAPDRGAQRSRILKLFMA